MEDKQFNILLEAVNENTKVTGDLRVEVKGLSTKMDIVVGPDGNNGTLKVLSDRVKSVEDRQTYFAGVSGAAGVGLGLIGRWLIAKILGTHDV